MIIVRLLSPGPWLVGTTKVYPGVGADIVMESITLIEMWHAEQPGNCSGPEVGFKEIAIDLLQPRLWIASGWPTTRSELRLTQPQIGFVETGILPIAFILRQDNRSEKLHAASCAIPFACYIKSWQRTAANRAI